MSIKVLVADDSITIQKVIGIIFGGGEYSLTVVDNGKSAVDKAREINPDILLIDALMPGMTGYEVAEVVRSIPSLATKPILILTGSFEPFDEEKAKKCGADDFIAKPFESQQIITKVKELLALGTARAQQSAQQKPSETTKQAQGFSAPVLDIPQPTESADIWDAFTPEAAAPVSTSTPPVAPTPAAEANELDVFAIVNEESDAQLVKNATETNISSRLTGSQWVPVEENTFEFEIETATEPTRPVLADQKIPVQEGSFGDISFDDDVVTPEPPTFSAVPKTDFSYTTPEVTTSTPQTMEFEAEPALVSAPVAEAVTPVTTAQSVPLTEEQLKAAIVAASKEVIERIVWEVVPDLAEAMIREAIRKIKEGA
ncbi:MAG: response regulator [Desulfuromonadaceae bacterium]|nr:response regulator [Desulfuromonadaceae bacterium]